MYYLFYTNLITIYMPIRVNIYYYSIIKPASDVYYKELIIIYII